MSANNMACHPDVVFLFGAGASYSSGKIHPRRPPLGSQLFQALRKRYPSSWGKIPRSPRKEFKRNFERGMHLAMQGQKSLGIPISTLMQDMAVYFSDFYPEPNRSNLYCRLLDRLKADRMLDRVLISTLNYECLVEEAAAIVGIQHAYALPNPADAPQVTIWKLHGSCNFKVEGHEASRMTNYFVPDDHQVMAFDGGICPLHRTKVREHYSGDTALYPAMCIYARNKPLSMSRSVINRIQRSWSDHIRTAKVICVIGVRPNPQDSHIWTPIAQAPGRFIYLGDEGAYKRWIKRHRVSRGSAFLGEKWRDHFESVFDHIKGCVA